MGGDNHDICMKAKCVLFCCGQQAGIAICGVLPDKNVDVALVSQCCKVILFMTSAVVLLLRYLCGLDIKLLILQCHETSNIKNVSICVSLRLLLEFNRR